MLLAGWLIFASLQGADLATTQAALKHGHEANPIMRGDITERVAVKVAVTVGVGVYAHTQRDRRVTRWVVWGLDAVYVGIVANNLQKERQR